MRVKVGFALFGLVILTAGCHAGRDAPVIIEYWVTGTAPMVSVEYAAADQGVTRAIHRDLPWEYDFGADSSTRFLSVSAQNEQDYGTVTVKILANHKVVMTKTDSGPYVTVTASTMWPY